jgi:hypothetical protein
MTALAPACRACSSIIAKASPRVFSHNSVKRVILPPARVCRAPPMVPKIDRERTVMPRTTPRLFTTWWPTISKAVVVIVASIEPLLLQNGTHGRACEFHSRRPPSISDL